MTIHQRKSEQVNQARAHEKTIWDGCVTCQITLERAQICANQDCEFLFKRAKATKDADALAIQLNRFSF